MTSVHSNVGYSLSKYIHPGNYIFQYNSLDDSSVVDTFSRDYLGRVKSPEELLILTPVRLLAASKKWLLSVTWVDGAGNVITEMYISEKGDTTSINSNRYNEHNKNTWFHMGSIDEETWRYDIYYVYDDRSNLVKSFQVSVFNIKQARLLILKSGLSINRFYECKQVPVLSGNRLSKRLNFIIGAFPVSLPGAPGC